MVQTRRTFLGDGAKLVAGGACLSLVGCSTAQVIVDIEIASTAIEVAAPIVAAFAGPGALLITGYMTAAAKGLDCVLAVAETPNVTTAQIAAAVASCLGSVIVPVLPAGIPANILAVVQAVIAAVTSLIKKYGSKMAVDAAKAAPKPVKLSWHDRREMKKVRKQLDGSLVKLTAKK